MRKIFIGIVVVLCIAVCAGTAYCGCSSCAKPSTCASASGECGQGGTMITKLGRGVCNCITFPFELFLQMSRTNRCDGPMAGVTVGLLKGVGMAGIRAAVGVYEVATFPLPCPECYRPILTDPEYMFEDQTW